MSDDNAGGVFRIDGDKINLLVDKVSVGVGILIERGLVVEPTIFGKKFPIPIRLGPEPSEGTA